ncbi:hypothetical protein [Bacillus atrophaeus]|uniref:hypothetical protein n=1 Tax=Bacillus atrophaeus TaxID=1452 RepID=UPI003872FD5C
MLTINYEQIIEKFKQTVEEYRKKINNGEIERAEQFVLEMGAEIETTAHFMEALKAGKRTIEDEISRHKGV